MFYRSLSDVEQVHVVEAFTFELGKCYEQAIKERELAVLANVDADLCEQVADGLGLPAPKGKPPADVHRLAGAVPGRRRARADRRPQGRRHRRRRFRPGRHREADARRSPLRVRTAGDRTGRRDAQVGSAHRDRRAHAADHAVDRVRRGRRRRGHHARPTTSSWFCCCRRLPALQGGRRVGRRSDALTAAGIALDGPGVLSPTASTRRSPLRWKAPSAFTECGNAAWTSWRPKLRLRAELSYYLSHRAVVRQSGAAAMASPTRSVDASRWPHRCVASSRCGNGVLAPAARFASAEDSVPKPIPVSCTAAASSSNASRSEHRRRPIRIPIATSIARRDDGSLRQVASLICFVLPSARAQAGCTPNG